MRNYWIHKFVIPFAVICFICAGVAVNLPAAAQVAGDLEVVFLDVGQGDAILVTTPSGFRVLIDGGDGKGPFVQDQAERVIIPYLRRAGIRRLDAVVLTHPHFDHLGGLITILGNRRIAVGEVLDAGSRYPSDTYIGFLRAIRDREEIRYRQPRPGDPLDWGPEVEVRVLGPLEEYDNPNNASLVIKLTFGEVSFLFTGDAEYQAEEAMIRRWGFGLRSTVLKAGHHGSSTSSSAEFLRYVRPRMVVVPVGEGNRFGHPSTEVIERLERMGVEVYRTDRNGTVTITSDGKELRVETEKEG